MNGKIEIKNVSKTFIPVETDKRPVHALGLINLVIEPGEFVCIVGTSGCGKSTLLRLIAGLEKPNGGEIFCDGELVDKPSPQRGMVFQEHSLFDWLNVRKNIVFALKAAKKYKKHDTLIDTLLQKADLVEFANSYAYQLSGGMRQRAALIRSLAVSPDILLLDEPLGALDSFTRMSLQDYIIQLWRERKNTMLMITHDVDEAVYLANRIVVMKPHAGKITQIVDIPMPYPRNRGSSEFASLRTKLLKHLDFAKEDEQDYNL
ncbi:MAG: ABC transporter ATP-binding protein [Firmicutes bacterium]|nr:ABC transporter ATP-binding protein [Bacillota bacterium]